MSYLALGNASVPFAKEIPKLRRNSEGWDEVRELIRAPSQQFLDTGAARTFEGHITGTFFVQDLQCVGCEFGKPIMEVISRGVAGGKGIIWESTAYSEIQSVDRLTGMPGGPAGFYKGRVAVPRVGMTARYISATAPASGAVGTAVAPGVNYGIPAYPFAWATADLVVYNFPSGWSIQKRDAKQLPGTNYHFVTDYFVHQHLATV
jgi:hypothetical protein